MPAFRCRTTAVFFRRTPRNVPVQYVLQATNLEKLQEVLPQFMAKVYENPVSDGRRRLEVQQTGSPHPKINRDKASVMGVSTKTSLKRCNTD